jgi:acyl dehydratase
MSEDGTRRAAEEDLAEELPLGRCFRSQGRTIGEGDFSALVNLTWTTGELHVNRELMTSERGTAILGRPGERVLALQAVAAVGVGLGWSRNIGPVLRHAYGVAVVRSLSFAVEAGEPLFPGDTVWSDSMLTGTRPTQDAARRVLDVEHRITNQRSEVVATIVQHLLYVQATVVDSPRMWQLP